MHCKLMKIKGSQKWHVTWGENNWKMGNGVLICIEEWKTAINTHIRHLQLQLTKDAMNISIL